MEIIVFFDFLCLGWVVSCVFFFVWVLLVVVGVFVGWVGGVSVEAKKRADQIIKNAEATAADIIAKAKAQSEKLESSAKPKAEAPKVEPEPAKESASSKFFKKADEDVHTAATSNDEDEEIFVGEIEDARKPDRMMIGDGEEEDEGFEFL